MNSVREVQNNCLKVSEDVIYHIAEVASCDVDGVTIKQPQSNVFNIYSRKVILQL